MVNGGIIQENEFWSFQRENFNNKFSGQKKLKAPIDSVILPEVLYNTIHSL